MRICVRVSLALLHLCTLLFAASCATAATPVATPYGESHLPFPLLKVPGAPVYYVIGHSGVPGPDNEGHTSNAGFVVTDAGVVVFDALGTPALGYRLLQRIREVTDQPIEKIIISHYHADHVYGLQAFVEHAGDPSVWAQREALGYLGGNAATQGEDAERRLNQRRDALFPWVDEQTYIVGPDRTFERDMEFELGGIGFRVRHLGPAHAPGDSMLYVEDFEVLLSGDLIYQGRIPFLDSPETDTGHWLAEIEELTRLQPMPSFVIPGHGDAMEDVAEAVSATREYIRYVRRVMSEAVATFQSFDQAYRQADWSEYEHLPAFDASNRGNAFRIFLEMEAQSFDQTPD